MTMRRGVDCRVKINGTFYAAQKWMVGGRNNPVNVTNTEGKAANPGATGSIGQAAKMDDIDEGRARLVSATWDDAANPFGAPLSLTPGDYVDLEVYPAGTAGVHHSYPNVLIVDIQHEGSVPGPQPVTIEFESDGFYRLASS